MRSLRFFVITVGKCSQKVGGVTSLLIFPMVIILVWEVSMRYVFNAPTFWAHETSQFIYGAHFILGGAFALHYKSHVNIEIFYSLFSLRARAILDLFTWLLFYLFCGFLLWRGAEQAWASISILEHSNSFWGPPLWPLRLIIPVAAALILLEGLSKTVNDAYTAVTGQKLVVEATKRAEA